MFRFLLRFFHQFLLPEFFHLIFLPRQTKDTPFLSFCRTSCFFHSRLSRSFFSSSRNWKPTPSFLPSFEIQKPTFLVFFNILQLGSDIKLNYSTKFEIESYIKSNKNNRRIVQRSLSFLYQNRIRNFPSHTKREREKKKGRSNFRRCVYSGLRRGRAMGGRKEERQREREKRCVAHTVINSCTMDGPILSPSLSFKLYGVPLQKKKRVRLPQRALSFSPRVSYLGLCTVIIHECKMSSVCCSLKSWLSRATVSRQRRNSIYRSCFSISLSLSRSSFSLVRCYLFVSGTTRRGQVKLSLEKIYKYNYSDDIKRERL